MAYVKTDPSADIMTPLRKWVEISAGGNVYISNRVVGHTLDFLVFKCSYCSANLHEGVLNFAGGGIPKGVIDFCKQHRHVCAKFTNANGVGYTNVEGRAVTHTCADCKWPFDAHDKDIWMSQVKAKELKSEGVWKQPKPLTYWSGTNISTELPAPKGHLAYVRPMEPVKIYSGRKFRED